MANLTILDYINEECDYIIFKSEEVSNACWKNRDIPEVYIINFLSGLNIIYTEFKRDVSDGTIATDEAFFKLNEIRLRKERLLNSKLYLKEKMGLL